MRLQIIIVFLSLLLIQATAQAGTMCRDGHYSESSGSGTCSHHGGEA